MMEAHVAAASVAVSGWVRAADPVPVRETLRGSAGASASAGRPGQDKDPVVITPGGPRPPDRVHPVRPGETLRQNEDGTFVIVPGDAPASPEPGDRKLGSTKPGGT